MKINYIKASNFLSFGNENPLFIDFTKYGNIVCIKGENLDIGKDASNGAGKSTIIEAIVYAFYGKLIKSLNQYEVINIKMKSKLEVEIGFELDGHAYVINRRREKNDLTLYKDGDLQKLGGIPATQDEINKIIKLNYNAFINIVCFGQHNAKPFLMCNPSEKRQIAESLLSLDKYNKFCESAKKRKTVILQKLEVIKAVYEKSSVNVQTAERQIINISKQREDWRMGQMNSIERLKLQIVRAKEEMAQIQPDSVSSYENISLVEESIQEKTKSRQAIQEAIREAEKKHSQVREDRQTLMLGTKELAYAIKKSEKDIEELKQQTHSLTTSNGTKCKVCFGVVNKENFQHVISHNEDQIAEIREEIKKNQTDWDAAAVKMGKYDRAIAAIVEAIENAKIRELGVVRNIRELESKRSQLTAAFQKNANAAALIIEQKIDTLSEQLEQKVTEYEAGDPYGPILANLEAELDFNRQKMMSQRKEVDEHTSQIPYYDFWIMGFGDKGIRSFIIDEIVPLLNAKINFWLQFLIDNKITLKFNTELVEKIERNPPDGDPFVHSAMSGGEHQRISLGISQGFANVTALTAGSCPSLVSLDEVGTNLDRPGIQSVFAMICELARDRQVLVTTHDPELLEMLSNYDTITVIKENGISRIK
jgi:DNA repair exonuclease SbcCD ATPase subunit